MSHNFAGVADRLDEIGNDTRFSAEFVGNMVRANLPTILAALRSAGTGRAEAESYERAETKIFARRFGSSHAKPCRDPSVATCARYECQFADSCQKPAGRSALNPPARGREESDG